MKVVEIPQDEPARVPDPPVGLDETLEDLLGDPDVLGIVLGGYPEPKDLGPVTVDDRLGIDHVPDGFGHLLPVAVHDEAVGQHIPIGGPPLVPTDSRSEE